MNSRKIIDEINSLDEDSDSAIKSARRGINVGTIIFIAGIFILIFGAYMYSTKDKRYAQEALTEFGEYISENKQEFYKEDIDYEELNENEEKRLEEEVSNIIIKKEFIDINRNLGIVINNQNGETTSGILIQVIFYNSENKPIKIAENSTNILESNIDYYITFTNTPEEYERYEFLISKEYEDLSIKSLKNSITYDVKEKNEDEIIISGKNSSSEIIDEIEFLLIYFDENDNILAVDNIYEYDIGKKKKFEIEEYLELYDDEYFEEVPYSRYEVVLTSAYSYEY